MEESSRCCWKIEIFSAVKVVETWVTCPPFLPSRILEGRGDCFPYYNSYSSDSLNIKPINILLRNFVKLELTY
jgi:hypothetical protein